MKSRRLAPLAALQLAMACGGLWGVTVAQPSWGQSAPQVSSPNTAAPRVISLPPPPGRSTPPISTPAYVPLPSRATSTQPDKAGLTANAQSEVSSSVAPAESLIDGMAELIPPLPSAQVNVGQFLANPLGNFAPPPLPAFPNASPGEAREADLPGSSMPRMTQPSQASMGFGGAPGPVANATNSLASNATFVNKAAGSPQSMPMAEDFPAGRLIAVVGNEHVLAGDMAVFVEPIIEQNRAKINSLEEEKKIRSQLTRQALRQYVEIKAIYQEFFRDMVGTVAPKELAETKKKVVTRAGKIFFEKQVPVLMKKYDATTMAELEQKLTDKSLSLTTLRGQFVEQVLASELERKFVPEKFEIDREDLINAYRDAKTVDKWNVAGRVRWRQLTVRFDKHTTRQEAEMRIRELGNEVYFGKSFEAVAKHSSEGYTASDGGVYHWTTQGSLKSKEIDHALFVLPLNSLSQVIADDIGLHILEVLEREDGHVQDFTVAQAELRESLSEERRRNEVRAFRDRIMARTTVWSLWPEDIPGSRPLTEALGNID